MRELSAVSKWPMPTRVLLASYDRAEHVANSAEHGVIGIRAERTASSNALRLRPDDWVLLRLSCFSDFRAARPARVVGRPVRQGRNSPYPDLLWAAEVEEGRVIYDVRVPVTFEGGPTTRPGCVSWSSLRALELRGRDGVILETPQQWGIKFSTGLLEGPSEVAALVRLLVRCSGEADVESGAG